MSSRSQQPGAAAGFVEEHWPDAVSMADTERRLALKLGLILLWSGRLVQAVAEFDSPARPRSVADQARLTARGVPPVVALIGDFRAMLTDPATTVGLVQDGSPGWFNWTGRHIPDEERVHAWMSPSYYEPPGRERRYSAGQIQEREFETAMLLIGIALWEYEVGHDDDGAEGDEPPT
jgi:hypothetical protein